MNETQIIPAHQWTNGDGEVLIVRQVQKDGSSSRGFVWPLTVGAAVKCPDWVPAPECGHGLHGWPLGLHIGDGAAPDPAMTWLVVGAQPSDVVSIGGAKVKMRRGVVRHVGTMGSARAFVRDALVAWVRHSATTGYGAHSATTGADAHSATTGARAHSATTGAYAVACALGVDSRARAGVGGAIVLVHYDHHGYPCPKAARVVDGTHGTLKPLTWYRLDDAGAFVECEP